MSRPRLTPHQREVYERIIHRYSFPWCKANGVPAAQIGSRGAIDHLIHKGYVEVQRTEYGPRGGERQFLRPVIE